MTHKRAECVLTSLYCLQTNGGSGGVKAVQVKGPSSGWQGLSNTFGAEWETGQQPNLPIDLHITADSGAEVCTDCRQMQKGEQTDWQLYMSQCHSQLAALHWLTVSGRVCCWHLSICVDCSCEQ